MPRPNGNTTDNDSKDTVYFKSTLPGLKVVVGDPEPSKGEVAPKTLRFEPYWMELKGVAGRVKIGYLKTDNGTAIKKLSADPNVTEIKKDEYEEATTEVFDDSKPAKQIGGFRAPY